MSITGQFVDTNVLVYAHDSSSAKKHAVAQSLFEELWSKRQGCLSIQVFQEFYATVTRKVATPLSGTEAAEVIRVLSVWPVHSPSVDDLQAAIKLHSRYDISIWDALILRSAIALGCETLWTEDLNDGQSYAGVVARNPFSQNRS